MYKTLVSFFFLFFKDPETAHHVALVFLRIIGFPPFKQILSLFTRVNDPALSQKIFKLTFKNPIGLAAGLDKEGQAIPGIEALGFGSIEVGTVTSHAQPGNPRPRLFRFEEDKAIINRMGFNNKGVAVMKEHLGIVRVKVPIGVSIGKSKVTELKDAAEDYLYSFSALYDVGNYFVVNVSSPNTPNLRQLQDTDFLANILGRLNHFRDIQPVRKPILLKIAPDTALKAIDEILHVCKEQKVDGIIAVNTSVGREGLHAPTEESGGLSGLPIQKRSTEIIRHIHEQAPTLPIIGVGGVFTAEDAYEKIKAGASLVQIYTAFIYEGPMVVKEINKGLAGLLKRDGFKNISEAVGK
ncbi:MAG: quinone-dependent dihydroorotate dehydrogenase [Patescibacteria group bacterium]